MLLGVLFFHTSFFAILSLYSEPTMYVACIVPKERVEACNGVFRAH